jgi:threonine/homoserine/homoserine lactone efflux protein
MPTLQFCLSLIALLLAPGPTNALLALGGAEAGAWRTLRLLPLVVVAYATTVLPLVTLGDDLLRQHHWVQLAVTFAAALWVAWMAIALWRPPTVGETTTASVSGTKLFVTTLLNPKAFIIGLVLIPAQAAQGAALAAFFAVLIAAAAAGVMLGATLRGARARKGLPVLRRVCAGWLGLLAVMLGSSLLAS